jgi:hypothetical protein
MKTPKNINLKQKKIKLNIISKTLLKHKQIRPHKFKIKETYNHEN